VRRREEIRGGGKRERKWESKKEKEENKRRWLSVCERERNKGYKGT